MPNNRKGLASRASILAGARMLLNERGLALTVEMIAKELNLTRGRITHFFPTKDSLMVGIMRDYEYKLSELLVRINGQEAMGFEHSFRLLDYILDLQYEYRCCITYLTMLGVHQSELLQHIEGAYFNRVDQLKTRLMLWSSQGLVESSLVDGPHFDIFLFQYMNLLSTWVISQTMYYSRRSFSAMKPIYIHGALNLLIPYLTEAGKTAFAKASQEFSSRYTAEETGS